MHDCPVSAGDAWAKATLGSYVDWASSHNSLLVLTFDESETRTQGNPIATVLAGPMVAPGRYPGRIDHYSLLRTIEDMYGLSPLGASVDRNPITGIWRTPLTTAPEAPAARR
jgi:phosphatidylinositol-3-phosphatase